jgi:uncharacterized protein
MFYGGEPLLALELIREVVAYTKRNYGMRRVNWAITTNGVLLTPSVWQFLAENDVAVTVSVDGSPELHDRYRVTANGRGTGKIIWENAFYGKRTFRKYYADKVRFNICLVPPYKLEAIRQFIGDRSGIVGDQNGINLIWAELDDSPYWRRMAGAERGAEGALREWRCEFEGRLGFALRATTTEAMTTKFLNNLFDKEYRLLADNLRNQARLGQIGWVEMPCKPGVDKLFVRCNGDMHICEKCYVSDKTRIGHVRTGIRRESVEAVLRELRQSRPKDCTRCWALRHCNICFADLRAEGRENQRMKLRPGICRSTRERTAARLAHFAAAGLENASFAAEYGMSTSDFTSGR